jgi:6-phosphogluconolactonase
MRADVDVRICADVNELSLRAAEALVARVNDAVRATGRCSVALSGGSTPRTLYRLLASQFREQIPWRQVHVFWGDERYVPPDDPRSNYRMAKEAVLDHVPCPVENIHPMPTYFPTPDLAARECERTLKSYFAEETPRFDLVLLGLGEDGHTASLFPGSPALAERRRWVVDVQTQADPPLRLTLTFPVLTRAATTYFLVAGSSKKQALHHILAGNADPNVYPAAGVRLEHGRLIWWVDRAAAGNGVER